MGGDRIFSNNLSSEDVSFLDRESEFPDPSLDLPTFLSEDGWGAKVETESVLNQEVGLLSGEFGDVGHQKSSRSVTFEACQRRIRAIYAEVLGSYEELQRRTGSLEEAKNRILSYTPGSWIRKFGGSKLGDYHVPEITSLLLVGPKGSGKSSLINKISRVLENDKFAPERAQVSYNSSAGEGTYFLQEYEIPRGSNSFCLYDTRCLSDDSSENTKIFKQWMTKGVRNGELVKRPSDGAIVKATIKSKARRNGNLSGKARVVNFVVMVVNGLSVLESMDSYDEGKKLYNQMIAKEFNNPYLSFKDDKPVVVVTHGDLLALSDRVRVRVYLGELLGIPPKTQVFDIADCNDSATELTIADLLCYCLEHADKNLPPNAGKMHTTSLRAYLLLLMVLGIGIIFAWMQSGCFHRHSAPPPSHVAFDWHTIRHLWLGVDYD
ncbi:unnamed protein product [Coffea canephora]|uniref:G domain-containing protein n=2 Tax=Coffea TaxID=13442 RepID=A0A068U8I6_COFCA|nr:unnamed protein product [Coffea canephora]